MPTRIGNLTIGCKKDIAKMQTIGLATKSCKKELNKRRKTWGQEEKGFTNA
jgi:hypothetical protein